MKIICEGDAGHVRVMNNEESMVSIESNAVSPKAVDLKRTNAMVSTSIHFPSCEMTPFWINKNSTQADVDSNVSGGFSGCFFSQ